MLLQPMMALSMLRKDCGLGSLFYHVAVETEFIHIFCLDFLILHSEIQYCSNK